MLRGMWDLPGPGLKPMFPALAGRFLTTAPPEKSPNALILKATHKSFKLLSLRELLHSHEVAASAPAKKENSRKACFTFLLKT